MKAPTHRTKIQLTKTEEMQLAVWTGSGAGIGVVLGLAVGNVALGIPIGVALGVALWGTLRARA